MFAAGALSIAAAGVFLRTAATPAAPHGTAPAAPGPEVTLAADGRIEGRSETVEVGPAISGVIDSVAVLEGQRVAAGAVLAQVRCFDLEAEIRSAASAEEALRQERVRMVRGRRAEERRIAAEQAAAAEADLREVRTRRARLEMLLEKDEIPRIQFDEVERQLAAAQARYEQARSEEALANAAPLPEELAKMDSEIAAAGEHLRAAEEQAAKCAIRAPAAGTVLRVAIHAGETVSSLVPRALFLLADTSRLRVRAEVDERDIGRVRLGQPVRVTADAMGPAVLTGKVLSLSPVMGRRTVLSGDPAEKTDRDTLEVLAGLESAPVSPAVGLRVTVRFLAAER
jgi:ABC exporter DevB family membrane fusion protein